MAIDLTERLDEATKQAQQFGAIPPSLGSGLTGQLQTPQTGFITGAKPGVPPVPMQVPGRDPGGVITAGAAQSAAADPMQRSGGVFGAIDMPGANAIMARENKIRGEMIDNSIKANGGNGIAIMPDRTNEPNEQLQAMKLSPKEYLDYQQGKLRQEAAISDSAAQRGITMRGQDINLQSDLNRNQVAMRGQDLGANTDAQRLGIDRDRLGIQQADSTRAGDKWSIDKSILQGQAADSNAVRSARQGLMDATKLGDPKAIALARNTAIAAGITFSKEESPSSSYTPNQAGMPGGMAVTKNPDGSMVLVPVDSKGTPGKPAVIGGKQIAGPSQADLEHTAKKHGMTVEQVKAKLAQQQGAK